MKKRILSVILCMAILLTVIFSVPFSVNAETAEIQAEPKVEVVENNDENISCDTTVENKEQTINIVKEEKADISDIGTDTVNEFEVDGIKYADIDDVSVKVIGYNKELLPEDLVIPETVEGKAVTEIGEKAFYFTFIESVILPETVTIIGKSAFHNCADLKTVTILGNATIEDCAFAYCHNLREVNLSDSITYIGVCAFTNANINSIDFPKNLESIGAGAFEYCELNQLVIPASVTSIGQNAFGSNYSLTEVILEERSTLLSLGQGAFSSCFKLASFDFAYCKLGRHTFVSCNSFTSIILPDSVDITSGIGAFARCSNLKTVELPDTADTIPEGFVRDCASLEAVEASKIKSIGNSAFINCPKITGFDFTNCTDIGNSAFSNCTGLTSVTLPDTDITVGTGVFSGCTNLKTVKLPDSMEAIPSYFFSGCKNLESIQTGKIKSIGSYAFSSCIKITDFDFTYCTSIGSGAFEKCTGFTNITLPDNIDTIPGGCFRGCTSLESIQTGEIKSIEYSAFSNCINLTDVSFAKDNSISTVDDEAFMNCSKLTEIDLNNVKLIYERAFENCTSLSKVGLEGNTNLESIGEGAFYNCISLEKIDIPSSCKGIGKTAFMNCHSLSEVTLREGLEEIKQQAFYNCYSLYQIFIPNSVKLIEAYALACFDYEGEVYAYSDFTVLGSPDSLADEYAEAYGVKYENALPAPKLTSVSNTDSGVKINFEKLSGVSGYYRVYRKTAGTSWTKLADVTSASYTDTTATAGTKYTYTVKFIGYDGTTSRYDKDGLSITRLKTPSVSKIENTASGAKITWGAVAGASKYRVYYKTSDGWKSISDTQETSFVHADAVSGTTYTYTVKAFDSDGTGSAHNSTGWTNKYITTPFVKNAEVTNGGVKLTWDKVAGAENYRVFIKNGSSWKGLATVSGATNNYVDKTATAGNSYTYTIRCMDSSGNFVSDYDKEGFTVRYLETPQITGFENTADGTVITWNEIEGAEKYRLYVKKDGSWTKLFDVEGTSFIHSDLEDGVEYTYTIRCITEDSKTLESGFDSTGFTNLYEKPEITVLTGDADLDGELSVLDASLIQMYLVGKKTLEGEALVAADADLDGEISVLDASLIQMILVGKK